MFFSFRLYIYHHCLYVVLLKSIVLRPAPKIKTEYLVTHKIKCDLNVIHRQN